MDMRERHYSKGLAALVVALTFGVGVACTGTIAGGGSDGGGPGADVLLDANGDTTDNPDGEDTAGTDTSSDTPPGDVGPGDGSTDLPTDTNTNTDLPLCEPDTTPPGPPQDLMSPTRLLRRTVMTLTGKTPTVEQYEAMLAAANPAAQQTILDAAIDDALASTAFYQQLVAFGHDWIDVGRIDRGSRNESYWGNQAANLLFCGNDSAHPGALYHTTEGPGPKDNVLCNDASAVPAMIEPWWDPGTPVAVLGRAGSSVTQDGETDCGWSVGSYYDRILPSDNCGCGPNLVYCHPHSGKSLDTDYDEALPARQAWDEPARLLAHLVWHDRSLVDLILGNYTVAPLELRHLYIRMGRQNPLFAFLDNDDSWWRGTFAGAQDPMHTETTDPLAWREIVIERLNPHLLSLSEGMAPSASLDRYYHHDPRTTTEPIAGIPAAGILTSAVSMSSFPRERVRAARFLEMFACRTFIPPNSDIVFNEYHRDPATEGTCQHCHRLMDPAAIHFKRWVFDGHYIQNTAHLAGMEPWTTEYMAGTRSDDRWEKLFLHGTVMTPVTEAEMAANPDTRLMDFLPPDQDMFGLTSDGTNGPLGFAKLVVRSGEFDKCAARKLYKRFVGRELDPGKEAGFIDALAVDFVAGDRRVRPFIRQLLARPEFKRGL